MSDAPYQLMPAADGYKVRIRARGSAVLAAPAINRGTAFTPGERGALGLTGLLPTGVSTLDGQSQRVYEQFRQQGSDLQKWVTLCGDRSTRRSSSSRPNTPACAAERT